MTIEVSIVAFAVLNAFIALAMAGQSDCSSSSMPAAVLDVPFTFHLTGVNQTVNGDYVVCANVGNATSGLALYIQSIDNRNSAPVLRSDQLRPPFSPLLLALPFNETTARGHFFSDLRAGRTEFISAACRQALPQWWIIGLFDLHAELAAVFNNNNDYDFPPFDISVTFVLKKLPALFC